MLLCSCQKYCSFLAWLLCVLDPAADSFMSRNISKQHSYVILSVTWEEHNWNLLAAMWCTIPTDKAETGNFPMFGCTDDKHDSNIHIQLGLICKLSDAKPMRILDSMSLLSIVVKNASMWLFTVRIFTTAPEPQQWMSEKKGNVLTSAHKMFQ